eukprot:scaffold7639_cov258-Pinguiococcus_pyrenoidosus.AAC.9
MSQGLVPDFPHRRLRALSVCIGKLRREQHANLAQPATSQRQEPGQAFLRRKPSRKQEAGAGGDARRVCRSLGPVWLGRSAEASNHVGDVRRGETGNLGHSCLDVVGEHGLIRVREVMHDIQRPEIQSTRLRNAQPPHLGPQILGEARVQLQVAQCGAADLFCIKRSTRLQQRS